MASGYPGKVVNDQIDKVVFSKNLPLKKSSKNWIPFVATYRTKVKDFGKLIKDLLPFLYSDEEVFSYRSAEKIKDYIIRSKLYYVQRSVGVEDVKVLGAKFVKT